MKLKAPAWFEAFCLAPRPGSGVFTFLSARDKKVGRFLRQPTQMIRTELSAYVVDALLGINFDCGCWLRRQLKHCCFLTHH